jgi:hypothetical protein
MTDAALVPPASPLRIFAAAASGTLVERIIDGPPGMTWVDHGRPSSAAGASAVSSGGVVVPDPFTGAVHVLVLAGEALHMLSVPTIGQAGTWVTLSAPPPTSPVEQTWVSSSPAASTITAEPAQVFVSYFVVGSRRSVTGMLVGAPTEEVWLCGSDVRAGGIAYLINLGGPGRPPLAGTNTYLISEVRGHARELRRVYAASWPSQGGAESLDEWTYDLAPVGSAALGLPQTMPAPCTLVPQTMTGCGPPRHFDVRGVP